MSVDQQQNNDVDTSVDSADVSQSDGSQTDSQTDAGQQTDRQQDDTNNDQQDNSADKPIEYTEFTLPEGVTVNQELLDKFTPLFKEFKLDQDGAQKLVSLYAENVVKSQVEQWEQQKADWKSQTEADKEIGGAKLQETMFLAGKVMDTYGTDELKQVMNDYGLGNHPALVKLFARIGRDMSEDKMITGDNASGELSPEERMSKLYNNTPK